MKLSCVHGCPDPGYIYDDGIEVAFKIEIKILLRQSRVWYSEMVSSVYHTIDFCQQGFAWADEPYAVDSAGQCRSVQPHKCE